MNVVIADVEQAPLEATAAELGAVGIRTDVADADEVAGLAATTIDRFGAVLRSLGLRREERILLCLLDTIDWPTAFLGALKAGVVAIPVNTLMTEDDYRFMLTDSRARLLVVSDALYPRFAKLIGECPDLEHVIVSGENAGGHARFEDLIAAAVNDAVRKVEQNSQEKMSGMTAGMQLPPGFKMPF